RAISIDVLGAVERAAKIGVLCGASAEVESKNVNSGPVRSIARGIEPGEDVRFPRPDGGIKIRDSGGWYAINAGLEQIGNGRANEAVTKICDHIAIAIEGLIAGGVPSRICVKRNVWHCV